MKPVSGIRVGGILGRDIALAAMQSHRIQEIFDMFFRGVLRIPEYPHASDFFAFLCCSLPVFDPWFPESTGSELERRYPHDSDHTGSGRTCYTRCVSMPPAHRQVCRVAGFGRFKLPYRE